MLDAETLAYTASGLVCFCAACLRVECGCFAAEKIVLVFFDGDASARTFGFAPPFQQLYTHGNFLTVDIVGRATRLRKC